MPIDGEYEPSPRSWVRDQVELYERSGGTEGTLLRDTDMPVVIVTNRGAKSGKISKTPVMRVEHDGSYAMVASQGGAPTHPLWYHNVVASWPFGYRYTADFPPTYQFSGYPSESAGTRAP